MTAPSFAPLPDGGRLAYEVRGDGPPLLLARPLGGSMASWDRFAGAIARRFRVVAFDGRGTGASSPTPLVVTTRALAADALALLRHVEADVGPRVHVYGISLGGMVATWLAIDAPRRVDRLVLASTLPHGLAVSPDAAGRGASLARCLLARTAADADACLARRVLSRRFVAEHPDEVRRIEALARARPTPRRALVALLAAAARHDARGDLDRVRAPTLVLVGERDPLLTVESQRRLLAGVPDATFDVIAGAGHDVSAEAPDAVADRIARFLLAPP